MKKTNFGKAILGAWKTLRHYGHRSLTAAEVERCAIGWRFTVEVTEWKDGAGASHHFIIAASAAQEWEPVVQIGALADSPSAPADWREAVAAEIGRAIADQMEASEDVSDVDSALALLLEILTVTETGRSLCKQGDSLIIDDSPAYFSVGHSGGKLLTHCSYYGMGVSDSVELPLTQEAGFLYFRMLIGRAIVAHQSLLRQQES